ncbi:MAG: hypothetical protein GY928_30590 [Colwellia sp.]|nr:hypothetical protein [Colwellia sp.]
MKKEKVNLNQQKTHILEQMLAGAVGKRKQQILKVLAKRKVIIGFKD